MKDKSAKEILEAAFEKIAAGLDVKGPVYADLEGNVYSKDHYLERLRTDSRFAKQQVTSLIQPPGAPDEGITPSEQRTLARRFATYYETVQNPSVTKFLRVNPGLAESYTVGDFRRVLDTVKYELNINAGTPDAFCSAAPDMRLSTFIGTKKV